MIGLVKSSSYSKAVGMRGAVQEEGTDVPSP